MPETVDDLRRLVAMLTDLPGSTRIEWVADQIIVTPNEGRPRFITMESTSPPPRLGKVDPIVGGGIQA